MAALAAERKRQQRIRWAITAGVGVVAAGFVFVLVNRLSDDKSTDVASSTSTTLTPGTTVAPIVSVKGRPCVAVSEPLPAGAPAVPVKEGPPPTQLVAEDLAVGTGTVVNPGDTVTAKYIGVSCTTGQIFDSSYSRGPDGTQFSLKQVIKGWQDGIPGMAVGGQRLLGIPAEQAYGAQGRPPDIAPDEPLWFVVDVVAVQPG